MSTRIFSTISFLFSLLSLHVQGQHAAPANRKQALEKARLFYEKGLTYQQNDDFAQSIVLFDSALQYNPQSTEALFSMGSSFEKNGEFSKALGNYDKVLQLRPQFAGAAFRRAVCLYHLNLYDDAIHQLNLLIANSNGQSATNAVFYRYSESDGLSITTDNQISSEYYLWRGLARLEARLETRLEGGLESRNDSLRTALAFKDLDTAVSLSGGAADYLVNRGLAYQKLNNKAHAQRDYEAALKKDPENEIALLNLFTVNPELAQRHLKNLPDGNSGLIIPELLAQQAYIAYLNEDYAQSLALYNQALDIKPLQADWMLNRSLCLAKVGNTDKAEEDMLSVLEMDGHSPRVFLYLGNLYFLQEKFGEAVSFYNQYVALEPQHSSVYLNRGLALDRLGQHQHACKDLQTALRLGEAKATEPLQSLCTN